VHHNVDPGDGLADDPDLGELGGRSTGHLGNSEASQLSLEVLELLDQLFFLLLTQLGALDSSLKFSIKKITFLNVDKQPIYVIFLVNFLQLHSKILR